MEKNRTKLKSNKFITTIVVIALTFITIVQTVQIGQLMKVNEFQQETNIELNERITALETE